MSFIREFKEFAVRGNVVDMAVGVILGLSFGKIVTSLVNDIIMPPIGLLLGNMDFNNLAIHIGSSADGAPVLIRYGLFITVVIDFLLVALAIFFLVKLINSLKRIETPPSPNSKICPECMSSIPIAAKKCAHCTSSLLKI